MWHKKYAEPYYLSRARADLALIGPLAVFGIDGIERLHSLDHFAEGRETHAIEIEVVAIVDEELGRAAIRQVGRGKGDTPAGIALGNFVVGDRCVAPLAGQLGVAAHAPLHHKARHHPEKALLGEITLADQRVKAIGAVLAPAVVPMQLNLHVKCLVQP